MNPNLTDAEIDDICAGLSQPAAKVRFLMNLGLNVARKPNGAPLVNRAHYDRVLGITDKSSRSNEKGPVWGVH
jgi:hypothetical protein